MGNKKSVNKNLYYIRKDIRNSFHVDLKFDHKTKFELRDLNLKQIRLEFARNTNYMIFKCDNAEFLVEWLGGNRYNGKTQYYKLYQIDRRKIVTIESKISLGSVMGYIDLQNAKVYVRTDGGVSQQNQWTEQFSEPDLREEAERIFESGKSILLKSVGRRIQRELLEFDVNDVDSWEIFSDRIQSLVEEKDIDITEIVRREQGDPKTSWGEYDWGFILECWSDRIGHSAAKKRFWKACKKFC